MDAPASISQRLRQPLIFALILFGVLAGRSALADYYVIPSGSMEPTLLVGDRVAVNKLAYDLRIPFTLTRVLRWGSPERGEVVVFYEPRSGERMIKRVLAVAGDEVEIRGREVTVNGVRQPLEPRQGNAATAELSGELLWTQTPSRRHALRFSGAAFASRTQRHRVPAGHLFLVGDHRDNSLDSRSYGPVPVDQVIGRASRVLFSLDPERWPLPRAGRGFTALDPEQA